ncbi:MAG: A24 family peptidase, partial [Halobacteria archaeon]|nr:A24 family peptidase [Halobacteria archaeon]
MVDFFITDLVRVVFAVPVFGYAAYRDIQERRVPHRTWYPLVAVGILTLIADLLMRTNTRRIVVLSALSIGVGVLFGYGFYYIGTFGGADRYALVVLGLLFPVYPTF